MVFAYMGLGAGLGAIGALLVIGGGGLLTLIGLLWYPTLRLVRLLRRKRARETAMPTQSVAIEPESAPLSPPSDAPAHALAHAPDLAAPDGVGVALRSSGAIADADSTARTHTRWDRLLHRFAFAAIPAFKGLSDMESRLFRNRLAATPTGSPVFIAGLPRAGTTMLLRALAAVGPFATSSYRDMPFVLTPLLWHGLSRRLARRRILLVRAQGDGVVVSLDTPEALEEVVWRAFWPAKYHADHIEPWQASERDAHGEFAPFLASHFAKTIAVRRKQGQPASRYLSKNNANLARVANILTLHPDASVVVPFREPRRQAASLLRQHRRFQQIHATDPFAKRYMANVGHFEFGANLKPINFDGWLSGDADQRTPRSEAADLDFWLRYWCAAYRHALAETRDNMVFVGYEAIRARPFETLTNLCERLRIHPAHRTVEAVAAEIQADDGAAAGDSADAVAGIDAALLDETSAIHEELLRRADNLGMAKNTGGQAR